MTSLSLKTRAATDVLNFDRLEGRLSNDRLTFAAAAPFPHIVLDQFLEPEACETLLAEAEGFDADWLQYAHYNQLKQGIRDRKQMGPGTRAVLDSLASPRFVAWLERLSGIQGLLWDPELDGGGLHKVERGGFLNMHTDFLAHTTRTSWSRQINLLIYLNKDWKDEYGGALELWDDTMTEKRAGVAPLFNRCLIFHTRNPSYHGHPHPLTCPPDRARRSLALYYFRDEGRKLPLSPTNYRATPDDPMYKRALIRIDNILLNVYAVLKRRGVLKDNFVSRILGLLK